MINLRIRPQNVSKSSHATYTREWNETQRFWALMRDNPTFARQMQGIATLQALHRGNPDPGFWKALAAVGPQRLLQIAAGIERRQAQQAAIRARRDAAATWLAAPTNDGGGGCSANPFDWGDCVQDAGDWMGDRNWGDLIGGSLNMARGISMGTTGAALASLGALGCGPCIPIGLGWAAAGASKVRVRAVEINRGCSECTEYCSTRDQLFHAAQEQIPIVGDRIRCRRGGCDGGGLWQHW